MRTFIAVELNKENTEALAGLQDQLKAAEADVKWVSPQNIHLTLKFLGEVDENKIPRITRYLEEAASQVTPFSLRLSGIGAFPSLKIPRVVWIGLEEGKGRIEQLAALIEDNLVKLKFPREKRGFSGHCTLGRLRSDRNKDSLTRKIKTLSPVSLQQEINSIALFKSTLGRGGPVYERLSQISLARA